MALSVFGFQQSAIWGWSNPGTVLCIVAGVVLLVVLRTSSSSAPPSPLIQVRIFRIRAFLVENIVLGIAMLSFVPVFFFASEYAQIALGKTASAGRALSCSTSSSASWSPSQIGGRMLDRRGAKRPVVIGCALAAVGFGLWAGKVTQLNFSHQVWLRHPRRRRHGVHAHPGQHRRRQPGVPALLRRGHRHHPDGPELRRQPGAGHPRHHPGHQLRSRVTSLAGGAGRAPARARGRGVEASPRPRAASGSVATIPHFVRLDFAYATRTVFYVMAGIMAAAAAVGPGGPAAGSQEEPSGAADPAVGATP